MIDAPNKLPRKAGSASDAQLIADAIAAGRITRCPDGARSDDHLVTKYDPENNRICYMNADGTKLSKEQKQKLRNPKGTAIGVARRRKQVKQLREAGKTMRAIAAELGVSHATVTKDWAALQERAAK